MGSARLFVALWIIRLKYPFVGSSTVSKKREFDLPESQPLLIQSHSSNLRLGTSTRSSALSVDESLSVYTFSCTGSYQTFHVPDGVTSITVHAYGAQGACVNGGRGGFIVTTVPVMPNTPLYVFV